ncbi:MAG: peptidase C39 family protein [Candidatus Velthaea sp.]
MLSLVEPTGGRTIVRTAPVKRAVVVWNTRAVAGRIDLAVYRADGQVSGWLPYVEFAPGTRRSLCGADEVARITTDIVQSEVPIVAIEVRTDAALDAIAISTPLQNPARLWMPAIATLEVPALSQYVADRPTERGWCSPTTLAMLLAFWGSPRPLADVVRSVYDEAYGGTGNWAFNMAYASSLGYRATVVHLEGLAHASQFVAAGVPLALSYSWNGNELPGAPLDHSDGHLAVLRGFTRHGHPQLNDPAQPDILTTYDRSALERVWRAHGGVAYAVVPHERTPDLLQLANG